MKNKRIIPINVPFLISWTILLSKPAILMRIEGIQYKKKTSKEPRRSSASDLGMGLCICRHFWMRRTSALGLLSGCALLCFHGNYISAFCRLSATQVNANISHFSHNKAEKKAKQKKANAVEIVKCIQNVRRMRNLFEYLYIHTHTHTRRMSECVLLVCVRVCVMLFEFQSKSFSWEFRDYSTPKFHSHFSGN